VAKGGAEKKKRTYYLLWEGIDWAKQKVWAKEQRGEGASRGKVINALVTRRQGKITRKLNEKIKRSDPKSRETKRRRWQTDEGVGGEGETEEQ